MKKQAIRLETIALYATNYSFVRYRQMVCSKQSYGLQHLKLSFTSSKSIVYVFSLHVFRKTNEQYVLQLLSQLSVYYILFSKKIQTRLCWNNSVQ